MLHASLYIGYYPTGSGTPGVLYGRLEYSIEHVKAWKTGDGVCCITRPRGSQPLVRYMSTVPQRNGPNAIFSRGASIYMRTRCEQDVSDDGCACVPSVKRGHLVFRDASGVYSIVPKLLLARFWGRR
jgi:hypothetical protein